MSHGGDPAAGRIALAETPVENGVRPSVSHLFRSVAEACGSGAVGIILTGMGKDGALELAQMKAKGAVTVAQNKESCVVYGMPGEAVKLNGAVHTLSPEGIHGLFEFNQPPGANEIINALSVDVLTLKP